MVFDRQSYQRGNALFLILIAVILFAALAYAITKSQNGNAATVSDDRLSIAYSKYAGIQNAGAVEFTRLRLKGCAVDQIEQTLSATPTGGCAFYAPNGGSFPYAFTDNQISDAVSNTTTEAWYFYLFPACMPQIGDAMATDFVANVYLNNVATHRALCEYINKRNGITHMIDTNASPVEGSNTSWIESGGSCTTAFPAEFNTHNEGCLYDATAGMFVFYHVMEAH